MKKIASVSKDCVACGVCVKSCPLHAMIIDQGVRAVPTEKCVGCGKCALACPAGVITIVERGEN